MSLMIPLDNLANEFIEEYTLRRFAIDAEPVKHGRWEKQDDYSCCSHCGQAIADACVSWFNYCPNCGARMLED